MDKIAVLSLIGLLSLLSIVWISYSYFEAKSFNEISGKNVTTRKAIAYYSLSRLSNGADFNNDLTIFRSSLIASVAGKGSESSS